MPAVQSNQSERAVKSPYLGRISLGCLFLCAGSFATVIYANPPVPVSIFLFVVFLASLAASFILSAVACCRRKSKTPSAQVSFVVGGALIILFVLFSSADR